MTVMEALEYRVCSLSWVGGDHPPWLPITRDEKTQYLGEISISPKASLLANRGGKLYFGDVELRVVSQPQELEVK